MISGMSGAKSEEEGMGIARQRCPAKWKHRIEKAVMEAKARASRGGRSKRERKQPYEDTLREMSRKPVEEKAWNARIAVPTHSLA